MDYGFIRADADDGIHNGDEIATNDIEGSMVKFYRRIRHRLAYLAKDRDELALLMTDIAVALAAYLDGCM